MPPKESLEIVPATDSKWTKNCVVIPNGARPQLLEIISAAAKNQAKIDNSDDEAGDDEYHVQFPGHGQELLSYDEIAGRLRSLLHPELDGE